VSCLLSTSTLRSGRNRFLCPVYDDALLSQVHVHSTSSFSELRYAPQNSLIICEDIKELTDFSRTGRIGAILGVFPEEEQLIRAVAQSRLADGGQPSADLSLVSPVDSAAIRRVILAVLPKACSRHNAPSRCHAVTDIVKAHKSGSENLCIFIIPAKREHAFAQSCAAARPFSLYHHKHHAPINRRVDIVIDFPVSEAAKDKILVEKIGHVVSGIRLAQRLVDAPPNVLHSTRYVEECRDVARSVGAQIEVIHGEELERRGFGGIWGVGKASEHLPALVILSHVPEGADPSQSICLVGKGIIYDTGGLSIKSKEGMPGMKVDMGGSAAVLGAFQSIALANVSYHVHGLLCIAENSVGPLATRPDDIQTFYSGLTVEVNNTDAEGRLVLADGCAYAARHLNPRVIIDIATLTGAQGIATGQRHAALYCNDDRLEDLAVRAGRSSGDLTHPLPYCPEFFKLEFTSEVADMKNSVKNRSNAQSACAGQFIGNHIEVNRRLKLVNEVIVN
jgi:probable aminopeptidase NPEPL1